jgi:hypothetical protein
LGREAKVQAQFDGLLEMGRLQWEAPELIFRGATREIWRGPQLVGIRAEGDDLVLADGARFTLGDAFQAENWLKAITNPPSRLDKLGVKPHHRVALIGIEDPGFAKELAERVEVADDDEDQLDLIFTAIDDPEDFDLLPQLARLLGEKGAIWVVFRKGKNAGVKDTDVMKAARSFGLIDTKVCSFSDKRTALRFSRRKTPAAPAPEIEDDIEDDGDE